MLPILFSIAAIVFSTVILQLGNNMIAPLLVLRASNAGENLGYVGLIPTAYGIGFVFGCFWGQKLINHINKAYKAAINRRDSHKDRNHYSLYWQNGKHKNCL